MTTKRSPTPPTLEDIKVLDTLLRHKAEQIVLVNAELQASIHNQRMVLQRAEISMLFASREENGHLHSDEPELRRNIAALVDSRKTIIGALGQINKELESMDRRIAQSVEKPIEPGPKIAVRLLRMSSLKKQILTFLLERFPGSVGTDTIIEYVLQQHKENSPAELAPTKRTVGVNLNGLKSMTLITNERLYGQVQVVWRLNIDEAPQTKRSPTAAHSLPVSARTVLKIATSFINSATLRPVSTADLLSHIVSAYSTEKHNALDLREIYQSALKKINYYKSQGTLIRTGPLGPLANVYMWDVRLSQSIPKDHNLAMAMASMRDAAASRAPQAPAAALLPPSPGSSLPPPDMHLAQVTLLKIIERRFPKAATAAQLIKDSDLLATLSDLPPDIDPSKLMASVLVHLTELERQGRLDAHPSSARRGVAWSLHVSPAVLTIVKQPVRTHRFLRGALKAAYCEFVENARGAEVKSGDAINFAFNKIGTDAASLPKAQRRHYRKYFNELRKSGAFGPNI